MKKLILLFFILTTWNIVYSQFKRFAIEGNFSLGNYEERGSYQNYKLGYMGYSGRIQYNFPWLFSINVGYGQEHQSFVNVSMQDLSPGYYETSNVRTTERIVPVALRMTFGRRFCFYAEAGSQWNFKGSAKVDAFVDYWNNVDNQDYNYSYNKSLDDPFANSAQEKKYNRVRPFFGLGLNFPVFADLHAHVEFRSQIFKGGEDFITDDHMSLHSINPYSRTKFSISLSYYFNVKKDSQFKFKTIYLKPIKNTDE